MGIGSPAGFSGKRGGIAANCESSNRFIHWKDCETHYKLNHTCTALHIHRITSSRTANEDSMNIETEQGGWKMQCPQVDYKAKGHSTPPTRVQTLALPSPRVRYFVAYNSGVMMKFNTVGAAGTRTQKTRNVRHNNQGKRTIISSNRWKPQSRNMWTVTNTIQSERSTQK